MFWALYAVMVVFFVMAFILTSWLLIPAWILFVILFWALHG